MQRLLQKSEFVRSHSRSFLSGQRPPKPEEDLAYSNPVKKEKPSYASSFILFRRTQKASEGEFCLWAASTEARRRFSELKFCQKEKPSYAKASEGEGGPSWDRTSDPLIMSQVLLTI